MLLHIGAFVIGFFIVSATVLSAVRTFILPRSAQDAIVWVVFRNMRRVFGLFLNGSYEQRDGVMALYAPISLLVLELVWLILVIIGYMGMFLAVGNHSLNEAFKISGSSIFTLGFAVVDDFPSAVLVFTEAGIGLILIALLISYLPTIYSAFSRRENLVTLLEVRAGSPPTGIEMIERFTRLKRLDRLVDIWVDWEAWFADIEETHTSLAALTFFRSPQPHRSWVVAAGAVLDAAALTHAAVDIPRTLEGQTVIRAGYLALRAIADFFNIPYNPVPLPTDPISITREEFDDAYDRLAKHDVPLRADRDQAWRDFSGWRVNYDRLLLAMAAITMSPKAPWVSDRLPAGGEISVPKWLKRHKRLIRGDED